MILTAANPALVKAVTIHPKAKRSPTETTMLKSVADNKKMGRKQTAVMKGKWAGKPMFQLSLEERSTCPSTCKQWASCYGNNMAFNHRIDHTHPDFYSMLEAEIVCLSARYSQGYVLRLHTLGDFFSADYTEFWIRMTHEHPRMHIFGFTHHFRDGPIGRLVEAWNESPRVWVRFSDQDGPMTATVDGPGIPCPQQIGKTESCLTCSLCWATTKAISFKHH